MGLALRVGIFWAANNLSMAEAEREFSKTRGEFLLWVGFLLPPAAWALQLQTLYLLSEYACATGDVLPNHIAAAVALILSLTGGVISWLNWQRAGSKWPGEQAGVIPRSRFLSALGLLSSALFSATIFAQWLPMILGVPCGK